jgi:hypothetical protein
VCDGTFHDPAIAAEKKNCLDGEQTTHEEIIKKWAHFAPADKTFSVETRQPAQGRASRRPPRRRTAPAVADVPIHHLR